jgi:hypothetical protein
VDPVTGADIALTGLIKPAALPSLIRIVETRFRKIHDIPPGTPLNETYLNFPDGKFKLSEHFGVTREGLVFYYQMAEVAATVVGPTEVVVPVDNSADSFA